MQNMQNMHENYYDILGVSKTATKDDIKKSYRKLSLQHHPDKCKDGDRDFYHKITNAYKILSDDHEKMNYDKQNQMNSIFANNNMNAMKIDPNIILNTMFGLSEADLANWDNGNMAIGGICIDDFGNMAKSGELNNMLSSMLSGLSGLGRGGSGLAGPTGFGVLGGLGRGGGVNEVGRTGGLNGINNLFNKIRKNNLDGFSNHEYKSKPATIHHNIELTLIDAYNGCRIPINIVRWVIDADIKREESETIYITIPKGIDANEIITLENEGNVISHNNKGDIKVKITINNTTKFDRNGIDLIYRKTISLKESLCGFSFDLNYIDGREFKINNEPGNIIPASFKKIIPKLGMSRDDAIGNLIIVFNIEYPKTLTLEQVKELSKIL